MSSYRFNMKSPTTTKQSSFTTDQSLHHCELLAESIFDEKSVVTFFTHREQKDFKRKLICSSLEKRDIATLSKLGASNFGFISADLRRESWYLLLCEQLLLPQDPRTDVSDDKFKHRDENQVHLDVQRSFTGVKDQQRKETLRTLLKNIIIRILRTHHQLNYYQGYHDVVSVFVVIFAQCKRYCPPDKMQEDVLLFSDMTNRDNEDVSFSTEDMNNNTSSTLTQMFENNDGKFAIDEQKLFRCVEAFTLLYLRDFMMDSLDFPIDQLRIIPRLIKTVDKDLYKKLRLDQVEPFFAVSSILTIFSHEMKPMEDGENSIIFCIFDYIISSQSMSVPLLMYANLVVENKNRLLEEYEANLDNFGNYIDLVHGIMQKVLLGVSYDEKLWDRILQKMRTDVKNVDFSYKKWVNKFSVLVTTATGKPIFTPHGNSQTRYDLNYVKNLLNKEVQLNAKRKLLSSQKNGEKKTNFALLHRLSSLTCSSSFIYKISIFVGLIALMIKFYRSSSITHLIPQTKMYISKLRSSSLAGLYQESKYIWLDPLYGVLQNMVTSVSSRNTSFVVNK